ncbi:MAG TPA: OmpH family outer membrane protein, partial [Verrucomicrobiae bacterium]|nr:OmpH family outer membrane protein [Verrucomicrobiae bacterium]
LMLTVMGSSALAQTKIATVDMRQLFNNYWKTKQAQAALQDQRDRLDKDDQDMRASLKKLNDEYQQLLTQANDQTISADERTRRNQAAADKLKQAQDLQTQITKYEQTAQSNISDQIQRMSEKVMADIQNHVNEAAKAAGYTLVLNTSSTSINLGGGASINIPSPVVYSGGQTDITADVLKQLNAGAPIDLNFSNSPPVSPVPPLSNTNGR